MSRAININALPAAILAACRKNNATVSSIEELRSGGTRVVLSNAHDAVVIGKAFQAKVLVGPVRRSPLVVKGSIREMAPDAPREPRAWSGASGVAATGTAKSRAAGIR